MTRIDARPILPALVFVWAGSMATSTWLQGRILSQRWGPNPSAFAASLDIDNCAPNPCQNGGTCENDAASYSCSCPEGFEGDDCEFDIDECAPDPCLNGGTCQDGVGEFTCTCPDGYSGKRCETGIDDCHPNPCQNGGTCMARLPSGFTCFCPSGYEGETCAIDLNQCAPNPCQNGGMCHQDNGGQTCTCPAGYSGMICEINIDDCDPNPCLNGGSCTDLVAGFSCTCTEGFSGDLCATVEGEGGCGDGEPCPCAGCCCDADNACDPNPCQNGGTCIDGDGTFTCECAPGFVGATCDELTEAAVRFSTSPCSAASEPPLTWALLLPLWILARQRRRPFRLSSTSHQGSPRMGARAKPRATTATPSPDRHKNSTPRQATTSPPAERATYPRSAPPTPSSSRKNGLGYKFHAGYHISYSPRAMSQAIGLKKN